MFGEYLKLLNLGMIWGIFEAFYDSLNWGFVNKG